MKNTNDRNHPDTEALQASRPLCGQKIFPGKALLSRTRKSTVQHSYIMTKYLAQDLMELRYSDSNAPDERSRSRFSVV